VVGKSMDWKYKTLRGTKFWLKDLAEEGIPAQIRIIQTEFGYIPEVVYNVSEGASGKTSLEPQETLAKAKETGIEEAKYLTSGNLPVLGLEGDSIYGK
jgi:hypothetical protein